MQLTLVTTRRSDRPTQIKSARRAPLPLLRTWLVLALLPLGLLGPGGAADARAARASDGAADATYSVRSALVRIGRRRGIVGVYFRMNRSLPFRADPDDATSTPFVRASVVVAGKRADVARGVGRMGDPDRHCYSDEKDFDALPTVLQRAKLGTYLSLSVTIAGRSRPVSGRALVIGDGVSPRARLRCGRKPPS